MSETVIRAEGLSKQYQIGTAQAAQRTAHEVLAEAFVSPFRLASRLFTWGKRQDTTSKIWALKDVSFEVRRGEVLGIIGRNGAGKSSLLKILSRITKPTSGSAVITGRVGSLLEIGTGFHPELTGRENIYLNGAILGMKRQEIARKFDDIVAFSEIERFLDTPVKHYSSGMYVRLAFGVAAHLEPEILIVDEVLAVGDVAFQKKCLGKMDQTASQGRTVLFVSHNMQAIEALCTRAALLDGGKITHNGSVAQVMASYLLSQGITSNGTFDLSSHALRQRSIPDSRFKWTRLSVRNSRGTTTSSLELKEPFTLVLSGTSSASVDMDVGLSIESAYGFSLFNSHASEVGLPTHFEPGEVVFRVAFDPNLLSPGAYTIALAANGAGVADCINEAATITIACASSRPGVELPPSFRGLILHPCEWSLEDPRKRGM